MIESARGAHRPDRTAGQAAQLRGVTVIGAHPDDIEIAAGGTVAGLVDGGVDVLAVVMTDEDDPEIARERRREALAGLGALGIASDAIEFVGLRDRTVVADAASIARLHWILGTRGHTADLVITHSNQDHHPDHRAVHAIVCAAVLPHHTVLGMSVVNSSLPTFRPALGLDIQRYVEAKATALDQHPSQDRRGRIRRLQLATVESRVGALVGTSRAEAFEVVACRDAAELGELIRIVGGGWFEDQPSLTATVSG